MAESAESAADLTESDYDALLAAVQETPRGRWFLAEYARRNRQADTQTLLAAIARLEAAMRSQVLLPPDDRLRGWLTDLGARIAQARQEAAAIHPALADGAAPGTGILAAAQTTAEGATAAILAAAELVQEAAWALREQEASTAPTMAPSTAPSCDFLDAQATDIYTACATQDLAHQCLRKAVEALADIETRIGALLAVAGGEAAPAPPVAAAPSDATAATDAAAPDAAAPDAAGTETGARASPAAAAPLVHDAPRTQPAEPLSALETLSPEETIALFT